MSTGSNSQTERPKSSKGHGVQTPKVSSKTPVSTSLTKNPKKTRVKWGEVLKERILSWKFSLLALSTWLFFKGTLSENGWLIMAASTTGLRELTTLMALRLGGRANKDEDCDDTVDNPDEPRHSK